MESSATSNSEDIKEYFSQQSLLERSISKLCKITYEDKPPIVFCQVAYKWLSPQVVDMPEELTPEQQKKLEEANTEKVFIKTKNKTAFTISMIAYIIVLIFADLVDPITALDFAFNDTMDLVIVLFSVYLFGWIGLLGLVEFSAYGLITYEAFFWLDFMWFHLIIFVVYITITLLDVRKKKGFVVLKTEEELVQESRQQREQLIQASTGMTASSPTQYAELTPEMVLGQQKTSRYFPKQNIFNEVLDTTSELSRLFFE